ncbi:TPA: hypothetical protein N7L69_002289 [Escherichia coli]|nr:hypothetical protein [Escherichia coli]
MTAKELVVCEQKTREFFVSYSYHKGQMVFPGFGHVFVKAPCISRETIEGTVELLKESNSFDVVIILNIIELEK